MNKRMSADKLSDEAWTHNTQSEFEDGLTFETELKYGKYSVQMFRLQTKNEDGNFVLYNDSAVYGVYFFIDDELVLKLEDSFVKLFREADLALTARVATHALKEINRMQDKGETK